MKIAKYQAYQWVLVALWGALSAGAQTVYFDTNNFLAAGSVDPSFTAPLPSHDGEPFLALSSQLQEDGKLLLAGEDDLIRLNVDGSLDRSFTPVLDAVTLDYERPLVQQDGRILVFGWVSNSFGPLVRLNSDGSFDSAFAPKLDSDPEQMVLQPDGKIIVGGWDASGSNDFVIERLNVDGSRDSGFTVKLESAGPSQVHAPRFAEQPDGRLLVAGGFTGVNGTVGGKFVRLNSDGTLDGNFAPTQALVDSVAVASGYNPRTLAVGPDGRILVVTDAGLAILKADGSRDGSGYGYEAFCEQKDGKWLVLHDDVPGRLKRMNSDGTPDLSFYPALDTANTVALQPDGNILVTGIERSSGQYGLFRLFGEPEHLSFRSMTRLSATTVSLTINAPSSWGPVYLGEIHVEASSDVKNWSDLSETSSDNSDQLTRDFIDEMASVDGQRFYRIRMVSQ